MKILFDHFSPFLLAHGGLQIQIEETKRALERLDVVVENLRWWDDKQQGDLIHFFGLPTGEYVDLAHKKKIGVVITHLLSGLGARPAWKRLLQRIIIGAGLQALPARLAARAGWSGWKTADAYIAVTPWEGQLMREVFRASPERVHVISNGVNDLFFEQSPESRGQWLVTTASILPVKRLLEAAQAAIAARTPYWIIGRPFSESDTYYKNFSDLCRRHPERLRYDNTMRTQHELAQIYRQAHGFVLLSRWESQSLSALEAAACGCPLFLSDLPWARNTFGEYASYCPLVSAKNTAGYLRKFYDEAPRLPAPPKPPTWSEVGKMLKKIYEQVLNQA